MKMRMGAGRVIGYAVVLGNSAPSAFPGVKHYKIGDASQTTLVDSRRLTGAPLVTERGLLSEDW